MQPTSSAPARHADRLVAWLGRRAWKLVFLFLVIGAIDQGFANTNSGIDFAVFMRAARRFLSGAALYVPADGHFAFKYVPGAALFFAPFTVLPERLAWALWDVLSATALARVMFLSARGRSPPPGPVAHLVVLLFIMPFYAHMFFLGQCDALLLWAAVESEARTERQAPLSGALLALAIAFKLPFGLLGAVALVRREWRRLRWAAAVMIAILAIPAIRYGVRGDLALLQGWRTLLATSTAPLLCNDQNYSVFAVACTYVGGTAWMATAVALAAGSVVLVAASAAATARHDAPLGRDVALAGTVWLVAFLSPLGWRTNLVNAVPLLYLALALVRGAAVSAWRLAAAGVLLVSMVLFQILPHVSRPAGWWLSAHRHYALVVCALACVALLGTAAQAVRAARGRCAAAGEPPGLYPRFS